MAILDTGVDPGAAGLSVTSDGRPKIIDIVDCTGGGDVDMSVETQICSEKDFVVGLTGRRLYITPELRALNPSGKYRLGVKAAFAFLPVALVKRLKSERRDDWLLQHRKVLNETQQTLQNLRTSDMRSRSSEDAVSKKTDPNSVSRQDSKLNIEEYEARISFLQCADKNFLDSGPVFDCLVFHDGRNHRVVVDTSEKGELASCAVLENFCVNRSYGTMFEVVNYAVNVYDDGKVLSIVVDSGSHGTHVAGIVSSYYEDSPEKNGMAPGAQIVSLKIGDTRLSSMETHQGLSRALAYLFCHSRKRGSPPLQDISCAHADALNVSGNEIGAKNDSSLRQSMTDRDDSDSGEHRGCGVNSSSAAEECAGRDRSSSDDATAGAYEFSQKVNTTEPQFLENKCERGQSVAPNDCSIVVDIANMSFGEPCRLPNRGRFVDIVTKLVRERNMVFVCSAGNNGPGLSTVSAPGGTTAAVIGVGAYVTPSMLQDAYNALDDDYFVTDADCVSTNLEDSAESTDIAQATEPAKADLPSDSAGLEDYILQNDFTTSPSSANAARRRIVSSNSNRTPWMSRIRESDAQQLAGMPYTWSSRGPSVDGARGVSICAPGGAIASVPVWSLSRKRLMNGTSMASPSAAGAIAVLLSHLKSRNLSYTPDEIRCAIENSARPLSFPDSGAFALAQRSRSPSEKIELADYHLDANFACGHGSIDIVGALKHFMFRAKKSHRSSRDEQAKAERTQHANGQGTILKRDNVSTSTRGDDSKPTPTFVAGVRSEYDWHYVVTVDSTMAVSDRRASSSSPGAGVLRCPRGIYLRSWAETHYAQRMSVKVEPMRDGEEKCVGYKSDLAAMEAKIYLNATSDWIKVPSSVVVFGGGRTFPVLVDPSNLRPGIAHFGEISGFVRESRSMAERVFSVPVTVAKPEKVSSGSPSTMPLQRIFFSSGAVFRRFYSPPIGCTYGVLRIEGGDCDLDDVVESGDVVCTESQPRQGDLMPECTRMDESDLSLFRDKAESSKSASRSDGRKRSTQDVSSGPSWSFSASSRYLDVHVVQIENGRSYRETESRFSFPIVPGGVREFCFQVKSDATLELCIAQRWSSPGTLQLKQIDVCFCGLEVKPSALHMLPGNVCFPRLDIGNVLPSAEVPAVQSVNKKSHYNCHLVSGFSPKASLTHLTRCVAPCHCSLSALSTRDTLPDGKEVFQLILEYEFEVYESSSNVCVSFPGLNDRVYDAFIEGGPFVTVFDANKKLVLSSDIYPSGLSLPRGTYYTRAALRHDCVADLEMLKDLQALVSYKVSSVSLDCFESSHEAALCSESTAKRSSSRGWRGLLDRGERRAVYFGAPKKTSIPKWACLGDTLVGEFTVDEPHLACGGEHKTHFRVPKYPITMSVSPKVVSSDKSLAERMLTRAKRTGAPTIENNVDQNTTEDCSENADESTKWLEDAVQSLKLKALKGYLKEGKYRDFDRMYASLEGKCREEVSFLSLKLHRADLELCSLENKRVRDVSKLRELVLGVEAAADVVIKLVDASDVAERLGTLAEYENQDEVSKRKDSEQKRGTLVSALFKKARALLMLQEAQNLKQSSENVEESENASGGSHEAKSAADAFRDLSRWIRLDGKVSSGDPLGLGGDKSGFGFIGAQDYVQLCVKREMSRSRPCIALRILDNYFEGSHCAQPMPSSVARTRHSLLKTLGWDHVAAEDERRLVTHYPDGWELF